MVDAHEGDYVQVRRDDLLALLAAWDGSNGGHPYNRDRAFQAVPRLRESTGAHRRGQAAVMLRAMNRPSDDVESDEAFDRELAQSARDIAARRTNNAMPKDKSGVFQDVLRAVLDELRSGQAQSAALIIRNALGADNQDNDSEDSDV